MPRASGAPARLGRDRLAFVEFGIALFAGLAADSIALIGFGADSVVEALAGFVVLWLFTGRSGSSAASERRAQQLIAVSFYVLAAYVGIEAVRVEEVLGGPVSASSVKDYLRKGCRRRVPLFEYRGRDGYRLAR